MAFIPLLEIEGVNEATARIVKRWVSSCLLSYSTKKQNKGLSFCGLLDKKSFFVVFVFLLQVFIKNKILGFFITCLFVLQQYYRIVLRYYFKVDIFKIEESCFESQFCYICYTFNRNTFSVIQDFIIRGFIKSIFFKVTFDSYLGGFLVRVFIGYQIYNKLVLYLNLQD
eukprot:TRINITY_DN8388_c0_g1_i10.p2 TRINITY_DN8388_c0_g1~~TRINITY_DN8388_c0_g1_i10.p2  ORF type:complete len:169 (-),score=2.24 TRINITY_DN8388_c0_g1_i10:599-1105(-)